MNKATRKTPAPRGYTLIEENFNQIFDQNLSLEFIKQTLISRNLKSKTSSDSVTLHGAHNHEQSVGNLYIVFHQMVLVLSDVKAGVLELPRVTDSTRHHKFEHFEAFLQVFEAFGMGFSDDIDSRKYKIREKESHRDTAIKQLRSI